MDVLSAASPDPAARVRELARAIHPYHVRYEAAHDGRAVFAYVYFNITLDLAEQLEGNRPGFDDPAWVADLARVFAQRFIDAMAALDRADAGSPPPSQAWQDVRRSMTVTRSYVLEDLLYGMCAHIMYDLPHALLGVGFEPRRLRDFHLMNDLLGRKAEFIEHIVSKRYQRSLASLDRLAGHFDAFFTNYGIRVARSVAWYNALRLANAATTEETEHAIAGTTQGFIDSVRRPDSAFLRLLLAVFRFLFPPWRQWPAAPDPLPAELRGAEAERWRWRRH